MHQERVYFCNNVIDIMIIKQCPRLIGLALIKAILGNINSRILVPDKVDVWPGQIFADNLSSGVTRFVVLLIDSISKQQSCAGFVSESISANGSVRLARTPVIELKNYVIMHVHQITTSAMPPLAVKWIVVLRAASTCQNSRRNI